MEIVTPNTYVIKFEEKDHKVMANCIDLLREVTETMARLNCEILDSRYGKITRDEVEEIIDTIDVIRYAEMVKEA